MVRTHTLDPTPDAPRSYNLTLPIQLLIKDAMFGKTDSSKERLVQSTDQKSFKITTVKIKSIEQDCFVRFTALTGTEEEVKNYVIVGDMRRVGIIPRMFLHFRQLILSVNSYLEFITFFLQHACVNR